MTSNEGLTVCRAVYTAGWWRVLGVVPGDMARSLSVMTVILIHKRPYRFCFQNVKQLQFLLNIKSQIEMGKFTFWGHTKPFLTDYSEKKYFKGCLTPSSTWCQVLGKTLNSCLFVYYLHVHVCMLHLDFKDVRPVPVFAFNWKENNTLIKIFQKLNTCSCHKLG